MRFWSVKRRAAGAALFVIALAAAPAPAAIAPDPVSPAILAAISPADPDCAGLGAACVTQIGSANHAEIRIQGENGAGRIAPESASGMTTPDGAAAADLVMPGLDSGIVHQQGAGNRAAIAISGQGNLFHVAQTGDRNIASQLISGNGNSAAIEQGAALSDSGNIATQLQIGDANVARIRQLGSFNTAVQTQAPSAEMALLGAAGAAGGAVGNRMLLEQNGDHNEAYLTQAGFNNSIALRQMGGAEITIIQLGAGHSIGIEQPAGQRGVQILQY